MSEIEKDQDTAPMNDAGESDSLERVEKSSAPAKQKRGKKQKTEGEIVNSVEWTDEAQSLAFVESETSGQNADQSADQSADQNADLNAFEELARRVAETVARNQGDENVAMSAPIASVDPVDPMNSMDPMDPANDATMEQMGFQALEQELEAAENDADPEPTEFVEHDQLLSVIESLLFSTDKPVSVATIKQVFKGSNVRSKDIARALDLLASDYASSVRGVTLEEVNGGYQLRTKSDNAEYLRRLAKVRPFRLSGPALEVMAIVAYKQPVTKHEIDEIRGVESGHLLRALMERGLVAFGEKSDLPGKPMTYNTTRKFLETFGLRNVRELPTLSEIDELLPEGIGDVEEKETLSDITDSMSQEITTTYSEGEDELAKINQQLQAVDTTTEFFEQEKVRERERKDRERAQDIRERLVLGDAVEEKDKRWLDRYEAKLHATPVATEASAEPAAIVGELEALTEEAAGQSTTSAASDLADEEAVISETEWQDDAEAFDDLAAHPDFDLDSSDEESGIDA